MLSTTGLCLAVHLVSDFALAIVSRRMTRVPVAVSVEPIQTADRNNKDWGSRTCPLPHFSAIILWGNDSYFIGYTKIASFIDLEVILFAWFKKGKNGGFVGRYQGKIILLPETAITQPGLYHIAITEELRTCYLARVIDQAAMLELPETGKRGSVRLQFAIDAYGPYAEESSIPRTGEEPIIRLYWAGIHQDQFDLEINRRARLRENQKPYRKQDFK